MYRKFTCKVLEKGGKRMLYYLHVKRLEKGEKRMLCLTNIKPQACVARAITLGESRALFSTQPSKNMMA